MSVEKPLLGGKGGDAASHAGPGGAVVGGIINPPLTCTQPTASLGIQYESPVAWSHDGQLLAFVSGAFSIYVQKVVDGRFRTVTLLNGHTAGVKSLLFHPEDANVLLSLGPEGVWVWDIKEGRPSIKLGIGDRHGAHESDVECACWAYGGSTLITGSKDTSIKVWDATAKYRLMETVMGHKSSVLCVVFNPAREMLASAGRDSTIKVWDASTLAPKFRAKRADDGGITVQLQGNIDGHRGDVTTLTWSSAGDMIISGARDNTSKIWDPMHYTEVRDLQDRSKGPEGHHRGDVRKIIMMPGDKHCISAGLDSKLKVWALCEPDEVAAPLLDLDEIEKTRAETEARLLQQILGTDGADAAVSAPGLGGLPDKSDNLLASITAFDEKGIWAAEACPTAPMIVTSASGAAVRIWNIVDATRPALIQEFVGHTDKVNECHLVGGDDRHLLTCSDDYMINMYDSATFSRPQTFDFGASVQCLTVRPRNDALHQRGYVLAGGADYLIKAFPLNPEEVRPVLDACNAIMPPRRPQPFEFEAARFRGHAGRVMTITVHPSGKTMATGAHDFNIFLWKFDDALPDLAGNRSEHDVPVITPAARIDAHRGHVTGLAFQFAGDAASLLASCGSDHAVKVWRCSETGVMGPSLTAVWSADRKEEGGHTSVVSALTWGKNESSDILFSASWDHSIKAWEGGARAAAPLVTLTGHTARITDLDTSDTGEYLASCAADFTAVVWQAHAPFNALVRYTNSTTDGYLASISVGRELFVTATDKGQVALWPLPGGGRDSKFHKTTEGEQLGTAEVVEVAALVHAAAAPAAIAVTGGAGGGPSVPPSLPAPGGAAPVAGAAATST